ncbi:chromatin assembly factor 1 subunit B [Patella vulgata]|uniref:chromatin assembly factor 1 subunit B n=1 Tax=Patella vulgata TaxID=6465 RepID=UPI00218059CB|nr:chromatin assembly factor 1 subunit B [Patella vulgata]
MKVITPEISWHEREPIYSVDFQPGNHKMCRLASGGVDKTVRIWSLTVGTDGKGQLEFLCNLRRHTRAVNCCRFSPSGDLLATAGDDGVIILWKLSDTPTPVNNIFQDEDEDNKETWVTQKVLRGHIEDVYDLSWSADGKYLASGSVDNSAIVWEVAKDSKVAIFNEHKSFVQGVAMDPLNELVATLSTDRSCRIFNLNSKNCMHNIAKMSLPNNSPAEENKDNKPKSFRIFHDDTMRSFFRRLSFTPDGQLLITPAGCIERGEKVINSTHIFSRAAFSKPAVYLPSKEKSTIAVRVCPLLFQLRKIGAKLVEGMYKNRVIYLLSSCLHVCQ